MKILLVIIIGYLLGCGIAFDLIRLIEVFRDKKFTKKERTKLILGSWYSCIVLNNTFNRYD